MNEGTIYEELAKLVRYQGDNFVEGRDGTAAAKRFDSIRVLTHELASRVLDTGVYDEVPAGELKRGDLVVIQWADGARSIEQVVRTEVDSNEAGNRRTFEDGKMVPSKPWIYVVTTQTGGRFRTLGFCGGPVETATRKRIRLVSREAEAKILTSLAAELAAEVAEKVVIAAEEDQARRDAASTARAAAISAAIYGNFGGDEGARAAAISTAVYDKIVEDEIDDTPVVEHGYHDERVEGCELCYPELVEVDAGVFLPPSEADRFEARRESLLSGPDFDEVVAAVAAEGLREGARVECEVYGPGDVRRIEPSGAALVSFDRGALVHVSPSTLSAVLLVSAPFFAPPKTPSRRRLAPVVAAVALWLSGFVAALALGALS